jgi:hypothetical protein
MKAPSIHLGYEIGTGAPVEIPLKHMCITGQTQESGKTTTLEALITRSELSAIAFITKRGEASFDSGRQIRPYFEERADWEFVESVLEAIMNQRMKFERSWTVKACKGAHTLADVQRNVADLQAKAKRSMDQDLFMLLGEYLKKVVPMIQGLPKSSTVDLESGLNVMDLRSYPEELQHLVISSTIRWIYQHAKNVITIVPEAWKFAPQGRNTPVKVEIRRLAREGAGLKNYIWIDSQDIAGVEKEILRAASVWLIGVQREQNEIERSLASIPRGIKRPSEGEIPRLKLGEFFACWGEHVHKVYVQPAWMSPLVAIDIACGKSVDEALRRRERVLAEAEEDMENWKVLYEQEKTLRQSLEARIADLERNQRKDAQTAVPSPDLRSAADGRTAKREYSVAESLDNEQLYQAFKKRLMDEAPALIKVISTRPEIEVQTQRRTVTMNDDTIKGRLAMLISEGWLDQARGGSDVYKEMIRRGLAPKTPSIRVYEALSDFRSMGFFYVSEDKKYQTAPGAKVNVVAA